jgi:alginate O-acetyltransferase complex protein AlgI
MVSLNFFGFMAASALAYWMIRRQRSRVMFLSAVSLLFIFLHDQYAAVIVVALAIYATALGGLIARSRKPLYHRLSIVGILLVLVVFKYLGLFEGTVNNLARFVGLLPAFDIDHLVLPLGISYITFKFISYLSDIHWKIIDPAPFREVLCYGSLFTIFVAGPIERFERLKPQFQEPAPCFSWTDMESGLMRIAVGLFKKLVVADWIGYFITPVLHTPGEYSMGVRVAALVGYSFQIYLDFAGYSDIAIGGSRLLGLTIMENFTWPYFQPNISKFWQHWHISLSEWIRDYLFFPLSHVSRNRLWILLGVPLVAMALCGLWHGPAWHFAVWGIWHGAGLAALQLWNIQKRSHRVLSTLANSRAFNVASTIATFAFVSIGWLWFRS